MMNHFTLKLRLLMPLLLVGVIVLLTGISGNDLQAQTLQSGEPSDVVLKHEYVLITADDAKTYEANYKKYIEERNGNYRNLDLSGVDVTNSTITAISKQSSGRNEVMNQRGVIIVYGLANPGAGAADKQFYEMMFPIDYNGERKTPKGNMIYSVKMPTQRQAGTLPNARDILNCPPYCD